MAIDLSALEDTPVIQQVEQVPTGKPLEILLDLIDEDPNQPRTEFGDDDLQALADSIKLRGVLQPVSVRQHPNDAGRWILNFGARRYRASKLAGKTALPAFVDDSFDDYSQVVENEQRSNLTPMELALFIDKKSKEGDKKKDIAKRLGLPVNSVADYLALLEAPECVVAVYREGRCTSVRTLSDLSGLHAKFPEEVEFWLGDAEQEVTRKTVADLADELKGAGKKHSEKPAPQNTDPEPQAPYPTAGSTEIADDLGDNPDDSGVADEGKTKVPFHNPAIENNGAKADNEDSDVIKKPLLLVEYGGREAILLINKRPTSSGLVFIRYEDGSGDEEVDITLVKLNLLTSATLR